MSDYRESVDLKCDKCGVLINKSGDKLLILKMELRYTRRNLCEKCSEKVLAFVDEATNTPF